MIVYTVQAFRWGDKNLHSYIHGVYLSDKKAFKEAMLEQENRGGKYECEVKEWDLDKGEFKVVREIPELKPNHIRLDDAYGKTDDLQNRF